MLLPILHLYISDKHTIKTKHSIYYFIENYIAFNMPFFSPLSVCFFYYSVCCYSQFTLWSPMKVCHPMNSTVVLQTNMNHFLKTLFVSCISCSLCCDLSVVPLLLLTFSLCVTLWCFPSFLPHLRAVPLFHTSLNSFWSQYKRTKHCWQVVKKNKKKNSLKLRLYGANQILSAVLLTPSAGQLRSLRRNDFSNWALRLLHILLSIRPVIHPQSLNFWLSKSNKWNTSRENICHVL